MWDEVFGVWCEGSIRRVFSGPVRGSKVPRFGCRDEGFEPDVYSEVLRFGVWCLRSGVSGLEFKVGAPHVHSRVLSVVHNSTFHASGSGFRGFAPDVYSEVLRVDREFFIWHGHSVVPHGGRIRHSWLGVRYLVLLCFGFGFEVLALGWGLRHKVWGLGFRDQGLGLQVCCLGRRVEG